MSGPPSLQSLAHSVERDLSAEIEYEFGGADAITAVVATLDDMLKQHAMGLHAVFEQHGMDGAGKSELARKIASEMRTDFPDGQIFVDMLGTTRPRSAIDAMTDVLVAMGATEIQPASLTREYQSAVHGKRLLILLDNVADSGGLAELTPPAVAEVRMRLSRRLRNRH